MWFLNLITGASGKLILYLIGGATVLGVLSYLWFSYKGNVEENARLKQVNAQLEQTVKEQNKSIEHLQNLQKIQDNVTIELNKRLEENDIRYKNLESYLASADAQKNNRPASNILKQTIKELSNDKKRK